MPIKVIIEKERMMRCECGYTISLNDFEAYCYANCFSKDHFVGLLEDALCPSCTHNQLEEVDDG